MSFRIGNFLVFSMDRPPMTPATSVAMEARSGIDGVEVWDTGLRGQPFSVRTFVDVTGGVSAARALVKSYRAKIGERVHLTWNGVREDVQYTVLDVRPINVRQVGIGVGGLNGSSNAICECMWDLVARIQD